MAEKWIKETPLKDGWYWIKYDTKHGETMCPCEVIHIGEATMVHTARNTIFVEGPLHGGPGLKYCGKIDKSIRFGRGIRKPK